MPLQVVVWAGEGALHGKGFAWAWGGCCSAAWRAADEGWVLQYTRVYCRLGGKVTKGAAILPGELQVGGRGEMGRSALQASPDDMRRGQCSLVYCRLVVVG